MNIIMKEWREIAGISIEELAFFTNVDLALTQRLESENNVDCDPAIKMRIFRARSFFKLWPEETEYVRNLKEYFTQGEK